MARACFTLLQEGGLHLVLRTYPPRCPLQTFVTELHEVHYQQSDLKSKTRDISKHINKILQYTHIHNRKHEITVLEKGWDVKLCESQLKDSSLTHLAYSMVLTPDLSP